ncbi:cyclin-dependent protein kinase inhibitor SMR11-like [Abrus precatorius]|uniref:Cyclin-dependent protein kinase inhibitor SMR11-like n=1 Tax=Abrus precatorius TaxID=3816 RepID=A0A8B8K127_ABRPR|nr:cyclin-dependent protein kinase inhibitor SMR11-like [Abrus precatorius]
MDSTDLCKESKGDVPPKPKIEAEITDCLVPMTPDTVAENGEFQSPLTLTVVRKQLKHASINSDNDNDNDSGTPRTPKDGVFDPFAPGPDNMARAPHSNKYLDEYRTTVARRLNFHSSFDADVESLSDEDMVESVYENLLQVIVSKQAEAAWLLSQMSNHSDDCKTPPCPLRFTGISDTCPGAPMKPAGKPRNIQVGLCKKLEF